MNSFSSHSVDAYGRRISVTPAIRARARHQSNIWVFDSPKIGRRFATAGDVAFMHIVLLEGNVDVVAYEPTPQSVTGIVGGEPYETTLDAIVFFEDGREEWWEFKRASQAGPSRTGRSRKQLEAQSEAASSAGKTYRILTEMELAGKEILFDNWLHLCAAITRVRGRPRYREAELLYARMQHGQNCRLDELMKCDGIDPALMLGSIAGMLAKGILKADLAVSLFGRSSMLAWGKV